MFFTWRADFGLKLARLSRPDALRTWSACGLGLPLVSSFIGSSSSDGLGWLSAWRSRSGAAAGDPRRFLPGRQPSGLVAKAVSAVALSTPLARLVVVLRTLTPAPPSARTGAVASEAAPF